MSSRFDATPCEPALVARRASHVDAKFETAQGMCCQTLAGSPELHYLGHYTEGSYDFSYDRLDDLPGQPDRMDYERIGVQLTNAVCGFDRTLQDLKTGALIRTVVHGQRGMVLCNSGRDNEHVVGFAHAPTALPDGTTPLSELIGAREADRAVGQLVTQLREQVDLGSQNPGSWITEKPEEVELPVMELAAIQPHVEGVADPQVDSLFHEKVHPSNLQFMALCRSSQVVFLIDQFDHPQLGPYFQEISVIERRLGYHNICRQLPIMVRKAGRTVAAAVGGRVERLVLDVEMGAIYYYRILPSEYLVGVTLNQRQVARADDKIAETALACRGFSLVTPADG